MSDVLAIFFYLVGALLVVGLFILQFVIIWKFYEKAGRPGWAGIIPIYNVYTLLKIAGRPGWWLLLMLIPIVNIAVAIIAAIDISAAFNRSTTFGVVGLFLFSIIGYGIIAFGDDTYTQPIHQ